MNTYNDAVLSVIADMAALSVNSVESSANKVALDSVSVRVFLKVRASNREDENRWAFWINDAHTLDKMKHGFDELLETLAIDMPEYWFRSKGNVVDGFGMCSLVGQSPNLDNTVDGPVKVSYLVDYFVGRSITVRMKTDYGPGEITRVDKTIRDNQYFAADYSRG